jgi:hypothetical protein
MLVIVLATAHYSTPLWATSIQTTSSHHVSLYPTLSHFNPDHILPSCFSLPHSETLQSRPHPSIMFLSTPLWATSLQTTSFHHVLSTPLGVTSIQTTSSHHVSLTRTLIWYAPVSLTWCPLFGSSDQYVVCTFHRPMRATYTAHLIVLNFITLVVCGEEYNSSSYSSCNFLQPPVTSFLSVPIFSSGSCSQPPSNCFLP